ncbi:copper resistance protein B [Luteimonas fraxinea]|uniref:copper resistance protein B n=1 Tax=Luteimonas fraxinea TaxID=2901869 RepID=UPI001E4E4657|nr:copper resistance protein B [Luteimonas fraxinea]MCD9125842.1 copper resistance protein B [Luteimonas fraxinea]UHH10058.1 copper resistance protein B [Luteimonas fraxinea]
MPPATDDAHAHHRSEAAQPAGDLPADHPPREPLSPITDADRAAAFPEHLHGHEMHGDTIRSFVRIDRLEAFPGDHGSGQAWEADAWIGGDTDRLWLKASGERSAGRTHAADLDVLYGRSISPWWDVVAGARQSFRPGPSQTFAAVGIQGLAPYMFEVSAMAYAGEGGQVIGELELEYELLLTNRLILQPVVELALARRDDPARGIGSGLTKAEAGLRLRYEFTRKFAPYIGVVHERAYGDTRGLREATGVEPDDTKIVIGLRTWF